MKKVILSLAIPAIALGSVGCGSNEYYARAATLATTRQLCTFCPIEIPEPESAELKGSTLTIRGKCLGEPTSVEIPLSHTQIMQMYDTGRILVRGKMIRFDF